MARLLEILLQLVDGTHLGAGCERNLADVIGWPRCVAPIAVAAGCALGCAPAATAEPSSFSGRAADSVIDDLQTQGFNVAINWVNGFDTKPLSQCWVTNVNNPGGIAPTADSFTTVYVDVACPNGDGGDGGFGVGVGIG